LNVVKSSKLVVYYEDMTSVTIGAIHKRRPQNSGIF